jgi:uroporphyrin-III C-methyltransferase/precorrin-2 dehydrogenase/sirohydrochlorin ferrochelatase
MDYYPLFMRIADRTCVVAGGGAVAARKVEMLRRAGARVSVVAPHLNAELSRWAETGSIDHRGRMFFPNQLDGAVLVIAATGDTAMDAQVARHARLRGLPVNVVDNAALSSFVVPAVVDRSPVMVAVSTGGASPALARRIRARIEALLPPALGRFAGLLRKHRDTARHRIPDPVRRRRTWERVVAGPVSRLALAGDDREAEAALLNELAEPAAPIGEVHLVGAGPGDPELLTIKAHRVLESADVVVHDRLVGPGVVDLARRDAERIDVGKRAGDHVMPQDEINHLLIDLARDGKRVVRLKGGDPFVFGRGGEELAALTAAGVPCHVVPGITAATGCAAAAGIPLTQREISNTCVFVTGHGTNGPADLDWPALARAGQTLVIYMGVGALKGIAGNLVAHGLAPGTPAAVIENGTTAAQRIVRASVATIAEAAVRAEIRAPALIIVGEVAASAGSRSAPAAELAAAI